MMTTAQGNNPLPSRERDLRTRRRSWRPWIHQHQARLLLLAILLLIIVSPLADLWPGGQLLFALPAILIALAVVHYGRASRLTFRIALTLALGWLITLPSLGLFHIGPLWSTALMMILNILMLMMMSRQFIGAEHINIETMCAALSGYLLIGTIWSQSYFIISRFHSAVFAIAGTDRLSSSTLLYFSLQTLTTLGLGDILPTNSFVRMLVVVETIIGQFYLAAVIGRLASLIRSEPLKSK